MITPIFYNRDFSSKLQMPQAQYVVNDYSFRALGGPATATLSVTGGTEQLWALLDLLRCPVEFYNDQQQIVWSGCVAVVVLRAGVNEYTISLDDMGNQVTVAYGLTQSAHGHVSGTTRATTAAALHAESIATYGTKELHIMLAAATAAQATGLRDTVLAQRAKPQAGVRSRGAGSQADYSASIECRGWWDTLAWQYYAATVAVEEHQQAGYNYVLDEYRAAQQFQFASASDAWNVESVYARIWGHGLDLVMELCADAAGLPGAVLATSDVVPAGLVGDGRSEQYTAFLFAAPPQLAGSLPYWFVIRRADNVMSGAPFSVIIWSADSYPRGDNWNWRGSWVQQVGGDMSFQINGSMQTSAQIASIITAVGQFLSGVDNELPGGVSGVLSSRFRNGDLKALDEILPMLESGTSALVRMLATVGPDRRVRLSAEPLPAAAGLYQRLDGSLVDALSQPVDLTTCPCGVWLDQQGIVPAGVDLPSIAPLFPFFIEESSYNAISGVWLPVARGVSSVWRLAQIKL